MVTNHPKLRVDQSNCAWGSMAHKHLIWLKWLAKGRAEEKPAQQDDREVFLNSNAGRIR